MRPYYIVPDGKVGHDAYAVIRETIRSMDRVALARVVLTNREHVIALEARDNGLMGMLLRYPYEVRDAADYFDDIQDVKITKDMLDLARHIVEQKSGHFEPDKFEDHYEAALTELINNKVSGQPIAAKARPRGDNVVDLMDALRKSLGRLQGRAGRKDRGREAGGETRQGQEAQDRPGPEGNAAADQRRQIRRGQGGGRQGEEAGAQRGEWQGPQGGLIRFQARGCAPPLEDRGCVQQRAQGLVELAAPEAYASTPCTAPPPPKRP